MFNLCNLIFLIFLCAIFVISSEGSISSSSSTTPSGPVQELWSKMWSTSKRKEYPNLSSSDVIPESELRDPKKTIWIVTTACLPWMTGTSINPLLRAAYLAKDRQPDKVYLMVPWLNKEEQDLTFPAGIRFDTPEEQRKYVLDWLRNEAQLPAAADKIKLVFYTGRYHHDFHSIFPMGDITQLIPDHLADVCLLEEPEHLNWYKAPFTAQAWQDKFQYVVGIIHTNYVLYSQSIAFGQIKGPLLYLINQGVTRAYCHKIIKLSGALQPFAAEKEVICNVHGVRDKFLKIGDHASVKKFTKGAYFIGKMAWPKGLKELFDLMIYVAKRTGSSTASSASSSSSILGGFEIDLYGSGPHLTEITKMAKERQLPTTFYPARDHALLQEYRLFVNPSVSEVLCTTIVEALAMNKWVVCRRHPSNDFFAQFPNCLFFSTEEEFAANVYWALHHDPSPLTRAQRHALSWEAATDRLLAACRMTKEEMSKAETFSDKFSAWMLESISGGSLGDTVRLLAGAGSVISQQNAYWSKYGTASPIIEEEGKEAKDKAKGEAASNEEEQTLSEEEERRVQAGLQEVLQAVNSQQPLPLSDQPTGGEAEATGTGDGSNSSSKA